MVPLGLFKLPSELLHVYCAVRSFDWQKEDEDRAGCTASAKTIAERIGKGERQTRGNLQRLAKLGAVRIEPQKGGALRILCTPEGFDPAGLTPAVHRRPLQPRQSTAAGSGGPLPEGAAVHRRRPRQSTADEVETLSRDIKQRQEVETLARGSTTAPAPALVLTTQEKKPVKRTKAKPQDPAPTAATWEAYAAAYAERYHGHRPERNARISGQLAQFLGRIPAHEAPEVAAFYVRHNDAFYSRKGHPVGCLLADAEKLHMEWATGRPVNAEVARRSEQTEANPFLRMSREIERRQKADVIDADAE